MAVTRTHFEASPQNIITKQPIPNMPTIATVAQSISAQHVSVKAIFAYLRPRERYVQVYIRVVDCRLCPYTLFACLLLRT